MPANTAVRGLPYPVGTDRLMDGDDAIRRLAQSVDNMIQTTTLAVPVSGNGIAGSLVWTFPIPFLEVPFCFACGQGGSASVTQQWSVMVAGTGSGALTTTQCTVFVARQTGGAGSPTIWVMAIGKVAAVA